MIKIQNMVPNVYYNQSRDFQLFGRIFDVVLNYLKNNSEIIHDSAININPNQQLLELICNTLGFKTIHNYDNNQLLGLCSIFISCMKRKGTASSLELLLKMVCSLQNSSEDPNVEYNYETDDLEIYIPSDITDLTLIRDVISYILPAGTSYSIVAQNATDVTIDSELDIMTNIKVTETWNPSSSSILNITRNASTGEIEYNNRNLEVSGESESFAQEFNESGEESIPEERLFLMNGKITTINDTNKETISENLAKTTGKENN